MGFVFKIGVPAALMRQSGFAPILMNQWVIQKWGEFANFVSALRLQN
jgi:hypothetical protein